MENQNFVKRGMQSVCMIIIAAIVHVEIKILFSLINTVVKITQL